MAPKQKSKKKQKTASASSSSTRNVLSSQEYAKERKKKMETLEFMNSCYLDWEVLKQYGLDERIRNLVEDKRWFKVMDMREPAYEDLTIEFLSTLKYEYDEDEEEWKITFQVYGEVRSIATRKIGVVLGYYENEEENADLPTDWPKNVSMENFWFDLIRPRRDHFVPSKSVNSLFADSDHKLLHHLLAHTVTCRKTSHNKLTTYDMFYLFSLITGYRVDLGIEVAQFLWRQADDTRTKQIVCGGYITQLLKGMGIFQAPEGDEGIPSKPISDKPFKGWGLVKIPINEQNDDDLDDQNIHPENIPSTSAHPPHISSSSSPGATLGRLEYEMKEFREEFKKEKKKNKKFRSTLFSMLKSAISCFNQDAANEMKYETSSEEEGESSTEPES